MCSFDGDNLFDSGPCRFHIGGRALRHELLTPHHAEGASLYTDGRSERRISQMGTLVADSVAAMSALTDAIELKIDGRPGSLIDHEGRTFERTVMLKFTPDVLKRLGPRWQIAYSIEYMQVIP